MSKSRAPCNGQKIRSVAGQFRIPLYHFNPHTSPSYIPAAVTITFLPYPIPVAMFTILRLTRYFCLLLICAFSSVGFAQIEPSWTVDDILLQESAGSFDISPNGDWAVWINSKMDKKKGSGISNLVLRSLSDTTEIPLTRGTDSFSSPKWSPDGSRIAFLTSRKAPDQKETVAGTQLWLINSRGGEPWALTSLERGIRAFEWKNNQTIVFLAEEAPSRHEQTVKKDKDTSRIVEDSENQPPVRLYAIDITKEKDERLTSNTDWMRALAVSPDGKWAVTTHQQSLSFSYDNKTTPTTWLTSLGTGEQTEVEAGNRILVNDLVWALDSNGFYYSYEVSNHPDYYQATETHLKYFEVESESTMEVDLDWDWGLGRGLQATKDGFIALLADGVRFNPARYVKRASSWSRTNISGTHEDNIWSIALGPDGETLVYNYSTASTPTQWFAGTLEGSQITGEKQITKLNSGWAKKKIHRSEIITWKGALDEDVEGVLFYPVGYEEGKRYPLMLSIHGGPTGTDTDSWRQSYGGPIVMLAERGTFVLKVNYHGSGNYGMEWAESIGMGKYYELERVDLINGVDHLIDRGLVDRDKVGTMGWSNGAILSTELITRYTDRFKVASVGAGDVEWISDWGNVSFGVTFDNYYFGSAPYENPDFYIEKSPFFRLPNVTTPTIIYHGTDDVNVPPSQSWSHYRVMQQATDTPVRLVLFPGEPHGLRKYVHQKRKLEEDLAWIDKYLFGKDDTDDKIVAESSPLERALKLAKAARVGNAYGVEADGNPVPEVVTYNEMKVGRFEVTRAQFAAFDNDYEVKPGTENLPASGLSFEQASSYASWAATVSGQAYRLPTQKELNKIAGTASDGENTLDYWAGYAVNPKNAASLRSRLAELGAPGALLREVGSFKATGKDPVFDLGGNVSEWAVGEDGKGVLVGGSADLPNDTKGLNLKAATAYRGMRLVVGG